MQLTEPALVEALVLINVDPCAKGWVDWAAAKVTHTHADAHRHAHAHSVYCDTHRAQYVVIYIMYVVIYIMCIVIHIMYVVIYIMCIVINIVYSIL